MTRDLSNLRLWWLRLWCSLFHNGMHVPVGDVRECRRCGVLRVRRKAAQSRTFVTGQIVALSVQDTCDNAATTPGDIFAGVDPEHLTQYRPLEINPAHLIWGDDDWPNVIGD